MHILANTGRKYGLVISKLDSRSNGCGFESRLIIDGNGQHFKAMPGSIPAPNSGRNKNKGSQMGQIDKNKTF